MAAPGWKQTPPAPSAVARSSSLASPAAARAHLASSGVAQLSTYAACTSTCAGAIPASSSAARKRATRSGFTPTFSL